MISELPLNEFGSLIKAAQEWEQAETKAEIEKRLFPLWLTERALHRIAGGKKSEYVSYSDYLKRAFEENDEAKGKTPEKPLKTAEDILNEFLPIIEADRGRENG